MSAGATAAHLAAGIAATVNDRGNDYGRPEDSFEAIARFWSAWLQARHAVVVKLHPDDVAHMMALLKTVRLARCPDHVDSARDGAAYTLLGLGCATRKGLPQ